MTALLPSASRPSDRTPAPPHVELAGVTRTFGTTLALAGVDLAVPAGSLTVIVGPSGCGKSTILRMIAGLDAPDSGTLRIAGDDVTARAAGERDVAMVFQDYALFPHMTVEGNISFGLRLQARHHRRSGPGRDEIRARVGEVCALLGLDNLLHRRPAQLSGGQRQRVALARAIVRRPALLLLDEPLSALDPQLRASARAEIRRLHRELGTTLVLVTHDQHEALSMATHLIVMDQGTVAQSGNPGELYRHPCNELVATFLGTPRMNLHDRDGVRIGWRPADGRSATHRDGVPPGAFLVDGVVESCEFTGDGQHARCAGPDGTFVLVQREGESWLEPGDTARVTVPAARLHRFGPDGRRLP
ncbi:ABC transporter ATP-binding protein [Myceligenerans pegani]|uniref:ABC transporter ATP-binding protein n=1 Tax=Myceligenerans pegani TaxID=2776917 RepID=A0ABR9N0W3_9MICO|nr:ABC transporter ATP-binding protein [Myceligenerans sp. TRM 65318]MBE1876652.1 ABC transporter ATP-binding protein [Myceligenerans sp. TRM 65318]MBE3018923.1 ABC transporter ATP-binding protein [Myceligenerans sp. TRM 65318]